MKRIIYAILIIFSIFIVACDNNDEHVHEYITKTNNVYHWQECSCGDKTEKISHNYNEGIIKKNPTELETGIILFTCLTCSHEYEETIPATKVQHNFGSWIEEVSPTCEKKGVAGHYYCDHCDTNFDIDYNEISILDLDKVNHNYTGEIITESTIATEGEAFVKCENCNFSGKVKVLKQPNLYVDGNHIKWDYDSNVDEYIVEVDGNFYKIGNTCEYDLSLESIGKTYKIYAYANSNDYFDSSSNIITLDFGDNIQNKYNHDFSDAQVFALEQHGGWGNTYPYGNFFDQMVKIIENNGNACMQICPSGWYPSICGFKKDISTNINTAGKYKLIFDVKGGTSQYVKQGAIDIVYVYEGGEIQISVNNKNLTEVSSSEWMTLSYEFTVPEGIVSNYANLDFFYWPEYELANNFVLVDNIKICKALDETETNIDLIGCGDFSIFGTNPFTESRWYLNDNIYIDSSSIGSGLTTIGNNNALKVYTTEDVAKIKININDEMANGGIFKISMKVKLGSEFTNLTSFCFEGEAYSEVHDEPFKIIDSTFFDISNVNHEEWVYVEAIVYGYTIFGVTQTNLVLEIELNNSIVNSDENYLLLDDIEIKHLQ